MNNTNRALNSTVVLVAGLVLLALGAAAIAIAVLPVFGAAFTDALEASRAAVSTALAATPLGSTGRSWLWIALAALCVVGILILLAFVLRQGHGHTSRLIDRRPAGDGAGGFTIDSAVAEQSLAAALSARPELVASGVSTYLVRGRPVLKVAVTARRGVSPRDLTEIVESLVRAWDRLLGEQIPVLIHISGGFRTRVAKATRLQ